MAEELDPCLHLSVQRENAGWFCQGCGEQFAPAADIRLVDDINARFAVKEWARRVVPMREVENAQRAVPRMESQDDRPITPEMVKISNLESRLRWLESDKIAPLEKNAADYERILGKLEELADLVRVRMAEFEKTVSDLDKRVGSEFSPPELSHSRMISNLTQAVMRLEKHAGISQ